MHDKLKALAYQHEDEIVIYCVSYEAEAEINYGHLLADLLIYISFLYKKHPSFQCQIACWSVAQFLCPKIIPCPLGSA